MNDLIKNNLSKKFHDMNNLLCACGGFIDILIEDDEDEKSKQELLISIRNCVVRLNNLVKDANDLTRL